MNFNADGVPIRAGLCLECSCTLIWWNDRLQCSCKGVNLKEFPIRSCNCSHPLPPGVSARPVLVVYPDTDLCYGNYDKDNSRCLTCSRRDICLWDTKKRAGGSP